MEITITLGTLEIALIGAIAVGIVANAVALYNLGKTLGEREALNYATEIVKEIGEGYKIPWTGY